jgi:HK97 family phage prohead protease
MTSAAINDLPDDAFAYIESGGKKDSSGKTTPRSLRHFPIHDKAHVQNALSRAPQSPFGAKAMPKIKAAAKKYGIKVGDQMNAAAPPRDSLFRAVYPGVMLEDRDVSGSGMPTLTGHFAVFNRWTEINSVFEGHFMERCAPGAFTKTIRENRDNMRVLFQHGRDPQIGDKPLGMIDTLTEDDTGARYEVPLFDTSYNRDLVPGLRAGAYGASFRFRVTREDFNRSAEPSEYNPGGLPERTIQEASVSEFGPVTFPAYAGATAGIRSLTDEFLIQAFTREPDRLRELMQHLQDPAHAPLDDAGLTTSSGRRDPEPFRPLVVIRKSNREGNAS